MTFAEWLKYSGQDFRKPTCNKRSWFPIFCWWPHRCAHTKQLLWLQKAFKSYTITEKEVNSSYSKFLANTSYSKFLVNTEVISSKAHTFARLKNE